MRTRLTLKPGRPGTKKLVAEYGRRLVCVRYRYDDERHMRIKTAEIVVEEREWTPAPARPDPLEYVHIRFDHHDTPTRTAVKRLGGLWEPTTRTWRITYAAASLLKLTDAIVIIPSTDPEPSASTQQQDGRVPTASDHLPSTADTAASLIKESDSGSK